MRLQAISSFNYGGSKPQITNSNTAVSDSKSFSKNGSYSPSFGIGIRGSLISSISKGQHILDLEEKSPVLRDMAEKFHTCPKIVIERVSAVYEWKGSFWNLLAMKDYNEAKSNSAYKKFTKAIDKVKTDKIKMQPEKLRELNKKAKDCYDEYIFYSRL